MLIAFPPGSEQCNMKCELNFAIEIEALIEQIEP